MAKLIADRVTEKFKDQLRTYFNLGGGYYSTDRSELPGTCGIDVLHELSNAPVGYQLQRLVEVLEYKGQVVLSDVVGCTNWKETKAVAYQGPITINPNSKNKIQLYIITWACLPELVKYLPKSIQNKYFK